MKYLKWLLSFTSRTVNLIFVVLLLVSLSASYISPAKIWIIPFFGLMLPVFTFINVLFVIAWILRRRYFAVVSLLAISACLPQYFKLFATRIQLSSNNPIATQSIKIMSYNVRDFDLYNWSENEHSKEEIFHTLKEKNPDIICFQEFYNDTTKEFNTIEQLKKIGYPYYFFTREVVLRGTDEWGIATFSKFPIVNKGNIMKQPFKTGYGKKPFKGIYTDIKIGDSTICVVNVHLQSLYFGKKEYETIAEFKETQDLDEHGTRSIVTKLKTGFSRRTKQAEELKAFLDKQTKPVLLCGDFNDLPNSYVMNLIAENRKDAFLENRFGIGHTYNGMIPFIRIDYIFASTNFDVQQFQIVDNKISDHYPIYGVFTWALAEKE